MPTAHTKPNRYATTQVTEEADPMKMPCNQPQMGMIEQLIGLRNYKIIYRDRH